MKQPEEMPLRTSGVVRRGGNPLVPLLLVLVLVALGAAWWLLGSFENKEGAEIDAPEKAVNRQAEPKRPERRARQQPDREESEIAAERETDRVDLPITAEPETDESEPEIPTDKKPVDEVPPRDDAGEAVTRDFAKSLALFKAAAEQGDAQGQYYLGHAYLTGSGVEADPVEALAWFIQAAARDHAEALAERDKGMAALGGNDRIRAVNRAKMLGPIVPAGWLRDPESGTAVWLPSWFRYGTFDLKLDVTARDGLAEGEGKAILTSHQPGNSDRTFEGLFRGGYFLGDAGRQRPFEMLPTDSYLVSLPTSDKTGFEEVSFWLQNEFGVRIAVEICHVPTNRTPGLLAVVPEIFPVLDEAAVTALLREAWRLYASFCPKNEYAKIDVVSTAHQRVIDRGDTTFQPLLAKAISMPPVRTSSASTSTAILPPRRRSNAGASKRKSTRPRPAGRSSAGTRRRRPLGAPSRFVAFASG